ncbi:MULTISPECIES: hypothetical protein [unclassified Saccharothrix]
MVFEFLESVFDALTKWSDAPNPPVPEGPLASVDEREAQNAATEDPDDQE